MQVVVLGMHRSGTSPVARLVNLMGLYFGPEGSGIPANEENPRGFWERKDVVALNDRLLASVGADWCDIYPFLVRNTTRDAINPVNADIAALALELDAHRPWFLKDPRFSLTLPFWRRVLDVPSVILCWRNPAAVAASLMRRGEMDGSPLEREEAYALWEVYSVAAINAALHCPHICVQFDELVGDSRAFSQRLRAWLEFQGAQSLRSPTSAELAAFMNPTLVRSSVDTSWHAYPSVVALVEGLTSGVLAPTRYSDWSVETLRTLHHRLRQGKPAPAAQMFKRLTEQTALNIEALLQKRVEESVGSRRQGWSSALLAEFIKHREGGN